MLFGTIFGALCSTALIYINPEEDMTVSGLPIGNCPWCCALNISEDIRFLLYTKSAPTEGIKIPLNDPGPAFQQARANPDSPTIFYIHGFVERAPSYSTLLMKDSYLGYGDYNVILIDWARLSAAPWYINAVRNTRVVGQTIADFLLKADSAGLFSLDKVQILGFSLGAEIAGFTGKAMPPTRRIPRITGLDPAFPLYYGGRRSHISSGDANFVDVIHTDAGLLGYPGPIGDSDFFPNGGKPIQPGCLFPRVLSTIVGCSHLRAWKFYAESIHNPYGFPATRCERWTGDSPPCRFTVDNYMGIMANPKKKGRFYLETNPEPPFAKSIPKITNENESIDEQETKSKFLGWLKK